MSVSADMPAADGQTQRSEAGFRYGAVFLLVLAVVVFAIVAPDGSGTRAISFALVGGALMIAVGTSREPTDVRRARTLIGGSVVAVITVGTGAGVIPKSVTLGVTALLTLAIPVTLGGGLVRLVRTRGATLQAVAGGLAIYLLIGLGFASAIGFVSAVEAGQYFAQGAADNASEHVYYSFTVLTTTGFGDLTASHSVGRALAVLEMLVGQLYLVTVISVLIGRRLEKR
jgi:ion channel